MIPKEQQGLYRRLLRYAFNYKLYLILSVFGFVLFSGMEAILVTTIEFFIDRLEGKPSDPLFNLSSEITSSYYFVPLMVIVLSFLRGIGSYLGNFFMSCVGLNVVNTLRKQVFTHMLYLPQEYYDQRNSGELVSLIIYNISQVTGSVTNAIKILLRDGFSVLFFLGAMLYINWLLTLIFFIIAPILAGIIYFASRYFRKTSRRIQTAVGKITHISTEAFQGIKLVKSYKGEPYEEERFETAADNNLKLSTKYERVKSLQTPVLHFVIAIALALIFYLVMKIWQGDMTDAVIYVTFAGMIAKPFRQLSTLNAVIQKGMAAAETIFYAIDSAAEKDEGKTELKDLQGKIEFRDVNFSYGGDAQALSNINLTLEPGETVALVGSSGSGKTTIANLLLRFYNKQGGGILIDGTDIEDIRLQSLRENIALVNQQTILFNDSVHANIAYGIARNKIDKQAVFQAAEDAYAKEFIENLEQGFDTEVGEDGALLSGGQRQRLAIARGLLKNAKILILDEATSALDNESEKQIQNALETLKRGRTTLVIAHRLSTIENADRIIVMDKGHIVEEGNHHSLLAKGGHYANLVNSEDTNAVS
ncbi:MAG: lipid A export permease/ATP-binding protein MsbA [Agarilytica sp.]